MYRLLIEKALQDEPVDPGFYFAENGVLEWDQLYKLMLEGLDLRTTIQDATEEQLHAMTEVLKWDKSLLRVRFAGRCVGRIGDDLKAPGASIPD